MLESLFQQDAVMGRAIAVRASFYEVISEQVRDVLKKDFYSPGGLKVRMMGGWTSLCCNAAVSPSYTLCIAVPCEVEGNYVLVRTLDGREGCSPTVCSERALCRRTLGTLSNTAGSRRLASLTNPSSVREPEVQGAAVQVTGMDARLRDCPTSSCRAWLTAKICSQGFYTLFRAFHPVRIPFSLWSSTQQNT